MTAPPVSPIPLPSLSSPPLSTWQRAKSKVGRKLPKPENETRTSFKSKREGPATVH